MMNPRAIVGTSIGGVFTTCLVSYITSHGSGLLEHMFTAYGYHTKAVYYTSWVDWMKQASAVSTAMSAHNQTNLVLFLLPPVLANDRILEVCFRACLISIACLRVMPAGRLATRPAGTCLLSFAVRVHKSTWCLFRNLEISVCEATPNPQPLLPSFRESVLPSALSLPLASSFCT